jgi:hypothetical protein
MNMKQQMKVLILSTHPTVEKWKTLPQKLAFFDRLYSSGKNSNFAPTELKKIDVVPKVVNSRIDFTWLESIKKIYFNQGYDIIKFHGSLKQQKEWGIELGLRGANPNSKSELESMYFFADEHSKREGLNQFEQTGGHEGAHGYYDHSGERDITHEWHDNHPDISGLFIQFDWAKYQPNRMRLRKVRNILREVVDLKTILKSKQERQLLPLVQRKADAIISEMARRGHPVRIVQGFRSIEEQNKLYAQGRNGNPGAIVTRARGGESFHNYGVAVDFVFRKEGYNATEALWQLLGRVGKAQGFEWGGDWKGFVDRPHFELTLGYGIKDFKDSKVDYTKYI